MEFAQAMGPIMIPPARMVAELVTPPADRDIRVLDISASHGAYGIAFAQKNPRAHLVALDWPNVLEVTVANAHAAGLANRFSKSPATPSPSISARITTSSWCRISCITFPPPTARNSSAASTPPCGPEEGW
jgi:hypothetical protein